MADDDFEAYLARIVELAGQAKANKDGDLEVTLPPMPPVPKTHAEAMRQVLDRLEKATGVKWGESELPDGTRIVLRPAKPRKA